MVCVLLGSASFLGGGAIFSVTSSRFLLTNAVCCSSLILLSN